MTNPKGHPATLVAVSEGNSNAVRHGAYSSTGRVLTKRAQGLAQALMTAPHVVPLDSVAAEEIGALLARIEAIDKDLEERGHRARTLLDTRVKLTRELRTWLREFGGTPKARAEFAKALATGGLAAEIARRRVQREEEAHER